MSKKNQQKNHATQAKLRAKHRPVDPKSTLAYRASDEGIAHALANSDINNTECTVKLITDDESIPALLDLFRRSDPEAKIMDDAIPSIKNKYLNRLILAAYDKNGELAGALVTSAPMIGYLPAPLPEGVSRSFLSHRISNLDFLTWNNQIEPYLGAILMIEAERILRARRVEFWYGELEVPHRFIVSFYQSLGFAFSKNLPKEYEYLKTPFDSGALAMWYSKSLKTPTVI